MQAPKETDHFFLIEHTHALLDIATAEEHKVGSFEYRLRLFRISVPPHRGGECHLARSRLLQKPGNPES